MEKHVGQGHGIAGRFAGLPEEFSALDSSAIVISSIAFDKTVTYRSGTKDGPSAIIEASRNLELYDIETNSEVYLKGIHTIPILYPNDSQEMLEKAYQQTKNLLKKNKFVVTLGGEHSISLPPIKAHSELFSFSVLQLDAHADLQKAYEGNPHSHASVMARVLELPNIQSVVSVGVRSMSSEELDLVQKTTPFYSHVIAKSPNWMHEVVDKLSDNVYLTLDLDVFDSSIMPSTGTPEPGGLNWEQVTNLLLLVNAKRNVIGFDVVELSPNLQDVSPDYLTAKLIYKLLSYKYYGEQKNEH